MEDCWELPSLRKKNSFAKPAVSIKSARDQSARPNRTQKYERPSNWTTRCNHAHDQRSTALNSGQKKRLRTSLFSRVQSLSWGCYFVAFRTSGTVKCALWINKPTANPKQQRCKPLSSLQPFSTEPYVQTSPSEILCHWALFHKHPPIDENPVDSAQRKLVSTL
jgi:hypothetical protein